MKSEIICVFVGDDKKLSALVQEVAFKCGYCWFCDTQKKPNLYEEAAYLFFDKTNKYITWAEDRQGFRTIDARTDFDCVVRAFLGEQKPDWRDRFYKALESGKTIAYKFPWHKEDTWAIAKKEAAKFYLDCADPERPNEHLAIIGEDLPELPPQDFLDKYDYENTFQARIPNLGEFYYSHFFGKVEQYLIPTQIHKSVWILKRKPKLDISIKCVCRTSFTRLPILPPPTLPGLV